MAISLGILTQHFQTNPYISIYSHIFPIYFPYISHIFPIIYPTFSDKPRWLPEIRERLILPPSADALYLPSFQQGSGQDSGLSASCGIIPWNPHEIPMKSHETPMKSHETPLKSHETPYEIPMKPPWNPYEIQATKDERLPVSSHLPRCGSRNRGFVDFFLNFKDIRRWLRMVGWL